MANIVISRIQHRRGRRENLPQPLLPAEVALTSDTGQAWIGQDPTLATPSINVYADKLEATAQGIVDDNILETRFDENMTVTIFNTLVSELVVAGGVTLVAADILWDDTYRGAIETITVDVAGSGYTTGDVVTAISATGSGFVGTIVDDGGSGILSVTITSGGINFRSANTTFTVANGTGGTLSVAVTDIYGSTVHIAANPTIDAGNTVANIGTTIDGLSATITNRLMSLTPHNAFGGIFGANTLVADNHTEASNVVALMNRVDGTTPGQVTGLVFTNLNIEITGGGGSATTVLDGTGNPQPIGYNTIPIYEIDVNAVFDIAHQGMMWHKDSGGAATFTCDNVPSIPQGASWGVHNGDTENILIDQGSGVTIRFIVAGAAPVSGGFTIAQGGIATIYKYSDTEYWAWGDTVAAGFANVSGTPVDNQLAVWTDASTIEGDTGLTWDGTKLTITGAEFIVEQNTQETPVIGQGQLWVRDDAPNVLVFTDDDGTDFVLSGSAVGISGTPLDNQIAVWTDGSTIEGDASLTWDGSQFLLPLDNDAVTPTLAFGDGDTGFYESVDDTITASFVGVAQWQWTAGEFRAIASGTPSMRNIAASATVPTLLPRGVDSNTGIGSPGEDELSIICGADEVVRFSEDTGGQWMTLNGVMYFQEFGAADADNAGFGQLWVRNYAPNALMFTDDVGTDFVVSGGPGANILYYNSVEEFRSADHTATDMISGAEIKDAEGNYLPAGVGVVINDATTFDTAATHTPFQQANATQTIYWVGTGASNFDTYTDVEASQTAIPVGTMWYVQCNGSGTLVIRGGTSVTIRYWAGTGAPADADVTVARGGVATIRKVSDSVYDVWGIGLS